MTVIGTFSIRIVDSDGNGVSGANVACHYATGGVGEEYTDDSGWAEFEIYTGSWPGIINTVWVNGTEVSSGFTADDGDTFSFVEP